jgi:hypothetical protein
MTVTDRGVYDAAIELRDATIEIATALREVSGSINRVNEAIHAATVELSHICEAIALAGGVRLPRGK